MDEDQINDLFDKAIRMPEHTQIARAFKACYPNIFKCINVRNNPWYYNNGIEWVHIKGNTDLIWYINEKFVPILEKKQSEICLEIIKNEDLELKYKYQNLITAIGKLIHKLSNQNFKVGLCKELKIYYMVST
jgi:hypothetical protein